ncbi:hypothetical protein [Methanococcoides sp. NM1]|nr:hypothetical protein [Methanococcoides sp. NM1]
MYLTLSKENKAKDDMKPVYVGKRDDSDLLRKKIIDMPYTEWKKMGF